MTVKKNDNKSVLDTINQVQLAIKSTGVYPADHPVTTEILHNSYEALVNLLNSKSVLTLSADGGKLLVDDIPIESPNNLSANFALDLDQRAIDSISFYRGLSRRDYLIFIKAMIQKPQSQSKNGDVASILRNNGISTIRLNRIKYKKVSGDVKEGVHDHTVNTGDTHESYHTTIINDFDLDPERLTVHADTTPGEQGKDDRKNDVSELISRESPTTPQKGNDVQEKEPLPGNGKKVKEYIDNLLSGRKSDELEALIGDISQKMDDKSGEVRKKIAEIFKI